MHALSLKDERLYYTLDNVFFLLDPLGTRGRNLVIKLLTNFDVKIGHHYSVYLVLQRRPSYIENWSEI